MKFLNDFYMRIDSIRSDLLTLASDIDERIENLEKELKNKENPFVLKKGQEDKARRINDICNRLAELELEDPKLKDGWKYDCGNREIESQEDRVAFFEVLDGKFNPEDLKESPTVHYHNLGDYVVLLKKLWKEMGDV